jgi:hypothetical protein
MAYVPPDPRAQDGTNVLVCQIVRVAWLVVFRWLGRAALRKSAAGSKLGAAALVRVAGELMFD